MGGGGGLRHNNERDDTTLAPISTDVYYSASSLRQHKGRVPPTIHHVKQSRDNVVLGRGVSPVGGGSACGRGSALWGEGSCTMTRT